MCCDWSVTSLNGQNRRNFGGRPGHSISDCPSPPGAIQVVLPSKLPPALRDGEAGDPQGWLALGVEYNTGKLGGDPPYWYQKAMEAYRKAADGGNCVAMLAIGDLYSNGRRPVPGSELAREDPIVPGRKYCNASTAGSAIQGQSCRGARRSTPYSPRSRIFRTRRLKPPVIIRDRRLRRAMRMAPDLTGAYSTVSSPPQWLSSRSTCWSRTLRREMRTAAAPTLVSPRCVASCRRIRLWLVREAAECSA